MKILHVTQGYFPAIGGTETLIQNISEELVRQFGDEVTVFTTNCYNSEGFRDPSIPCFPVGVEDINKVSVRRFPVRCRISQFARYPAAVAYRLKLPFNENLRWLVSGPVVPGLRRAISQEPADIIVASSFPLLHMLDALRGAQESCRPCVLHGGLHPTDNWGFDRSHLYHAIQQADRYIANTEFERQYVIERGAFPEKVVCIGLGVDPMRFESVTVEEAKRRFGLEGKSVVGYIGQLGRYKGIDTLIQAIPIIWQSEPNTHFLIAGARAQFAEKLEAMIAQFPEANRKKIKLIYNFGEEEKPWLFGALDVFAYPSGYESFGIAFLEAWILGKPVIGCRAGAIPWVIQADQDGLLVNYRDSSMLAEAILLLLRNPNLAQRFGQAGKRKVLKDYTWPQIVRKFRKVYLDAIEDKTRRS